MRWVGRRRFLEGFGLGIALATVPACDRAARRLLPVTHGGSPDWSLSEYRGTIQGFADRVTVADGDWLNLLVTTPAPTFSVEAYRLGWYAQGQSQAKLVHAQRDLPGVAQPAPAFDELTGLVSCAGWSSNASIRVEGWPTGLYLLKLVAADGDQAYIPLVVRDDRRHDLLFVHACATDQAYNAWGGKSLYDFNSAGAQTVGGTKGAVRVSFDRPFDGRGAGTSLTRWELNMVRWLEAEGFDVGYASDLEVHANPGFSDRASAVLFAGHDEYWSLETRDHLEAVHGAGKGLGLFTGDTSGWAVRFEDSPLGPDRVEVCYRRADVDPVAATQPARATVGWNEQPLNRPTHAFFGIGTNAMVKRSADWTVSGTAQEPELFEGTGLRDGDVVSNLVGYEYDSLWSSGSASDAPRGVTVLGKAHVEPTRPIPPGMPPERPVDEAHSVVVRRPGKGLIVAVGTIQWSWALDGYGAHTDDESRYTPVDRRLQALSRNLVRALISGPSR